MAPPRKYTLNEAFFDVVDTEEKAYWLGFLLADGCVAGGPGTAAGFHVRVELARRDAGHLDKLKTALGSNATIKTRETPTPQSLVYFSSAKLAKALINLGCTQRKTYGHPVPQIAPELVRHMLRGYFDGDGHLSCANGSGWIFGVVGTPGFMRFFQDCLVTHAGCEPTKLIAPEDDVTLCLRYGGGRQCERILHYLYDGSTVSLDRKQLRFNSLCIRPNKWAAAAAA